MYDDVEAKAPELVAVLKLHAPLYYCPSFIEQPYSKMASFCVKTG
jgi:hypothetical protein